MQPRAGYLYISERERHLLLKKRAKGTLIIVRVRDKSGGKGTSGSWERKIKARASFYSKYLTIKKPHDRWKEFFKPVKT